MRQIWTLIITLFIANNSFAKKTLPNEKQVKQWMENQPLQFHENKGQMHSGNGIAAPHVLFKVEAAHNLNIWVTKTGLTYQFFRKVSDVEKEKEENTPVKKRKKQQWHRVDMVLKGADIRKDNIVKGGVIGQGAKNYYLAHCPDGIFDVKSYTKVIIKEVYEGVDWVLYTSNDGSIKHDFVVHPHADPNQIRLIYEGSGDIHISDNQIRLNNNIGELTEGSLLCYQGNDKEPIESEYLLKKNTEPLYLGAGIALLKKIGKENLMETSHNEFSYEITFDLDDYDRNQKLVIDPQLTWLTLYGGNDAEGPMSIDCDATGNIVVTGYENSSIFPLVNPGSGGYYQSAYAGGLRDLFFLKFSNTGALLWVTNYGGSGDEHVHFLTTDNSGNVYATGYVKSTDFPTKNMTGAYNQSANAGSDDIFILKFSGNGVLDWSTYYGGSGSDKGYCIAIDPSNNIHITGSTSKSPFLATNNFPVLNSGGYFFGPGTTRRAIILKFSNTGALLWSTTYEGSKAGYCIDTDNSGNVFVAGSAGTGLNLKNVAGAYNQPTHGGWSDDLFITKFNNAGALLWATYYGGDGNDLPSSIAIDNVGNLFVTGLTTAISTIAVNTFPVFDAGSGAYYQPNQGSKNDAFVLKFSNTGTQLWSTYFGGNDHERALTQLSGYDNMALDNCGNVYVSLETRSTDLTTQGCKGYLDDSFYAEIASADFFIAKFNNNGIRLWGTYFGANGREYRPVLATDNNNNMYMAGEFRTSAFNNSLFPMTDMGGGAYYNDVHKGGDESFITKFVPDVPPTYSKLQVDNTTCTPAPCSGSATVTVLCGNPNYSYVWSNGSQTLDTPDSTNTITGLCPGNYWVELTSNCNYKDTVYFTIIDNSSCGCNLAITTQKGTANCAGCSCKDWVMVNATSGTPPFAYSWSSLPIGQDTGRYQNKLCTGNYNVTVTDSVGCSEVVSVSVP